MAQIRDFGIAVLQPCLCFGQRALRPVSFLGILAKKSARIHTLRVLKSHFIFTPVALHFALADARVQVDSVYSRFDPVMSRAWAFLFDHSTPGLFLVVLFICPSSPILLVISYIDQN